MTAPRLLTGLSDVADQYDVLLCDVWGVIHNGRRSFAAACAALTRFAAERGPVILISNSPRPSAAVKSQLTELGVPDSAWNAFVTSGDATRALLSERSPGPAWRIGPERDNVLYEGLGLRYAGPDAAAFVACTGPVDDDVETPEDYRADLATAAARGLTMICANPDRVVQRGEKLIYCGGALADLFVELGGQAIMAGKPYAAIYELCLAAAEVLLGRPAGGRVLCIGDGLATDLKGAETMGLDCLFVASGIHGADTAHASGGMDPDKLAAMLTAQNTVAAFAMPALGW